MIRPLLLATMLALTACGSPRVGEPFGAPVRLASSEAETGERVFMARCHECHPGGAAGLGPALNNKPLPALLIRLQTRHGLGAMPEFDEATISESELDALVAYLQELRRQRAS
jgi:mono/diheme cytochrome c family protein